MPLVTVPQAAEVLGVAVQTVYNWTSRGTLTRLDDTHGAPAYDLDDLEQRSLARLRYASTGHPYWATAREAADVLGVTVGRVRDLMARERMPGVVAPNGRRYIRRHQLEAYANARDLRGALAE